MNKLLVRHEVHYAKQKGINEIDAHSLGVFKSTYEVTTMKRTDNFLIRPDKTFESANRTEKVWKHE